ncbi:hypothetical protein DSO57_1027124 [Entomophthora muscae]|uniref:Uncharacterized protein n=1 Tax=Entomophthora muscae TaxID=34485 RepID=A0ACC2ULQ4_9FUNG|nr:hypothetical protein DSO57_1027124 [Entomophthora muscae]
MDFEPAQFNAYEQLFDEEVQGYHFPPPPPTNPTPKPPPPTTTPPTNISLNITKKILLFSTIFTPKPPYYYCQSVACNVQANADLSRLSQRGTLDTFKFVLAQFSALAFLKPEHTAQGFEVLSKDPYLVKHPEFRAFLEDFETQWIARAKANWDMYWAPINGKLKTTFAIEAYHKHLKANFGLRPNFNIFFPPLQHSKRRLSLSCLANRVPHQANHQVNLLHQGHPGCSQAQV